jgi:hypothetical protein
MGRRRWDNGSPARGDACPASKVLAQQDISVIERNVQAVGRTLTGKAKAAYDGMQEGLADCE